MRGNNRDRSGVNGEFLCIKGRYAFDFSDHAERLQSPMIRVNGKLEPVSWSKALSTIVAKKFGEIKARSGQVRRDRFEPHDQRREFLSPEVRARGPGHEQHRSPPHGRCRDADRCAQRDQRVAGHHADLYERKAFLIIGADLALEQPFLAFQIRANQRHHDAHIYVVTPRDVREDKYATQIHPASRAARNSKRSQNCAARLLPSRNW